jgi:uncharacterized small protein (DUF1192 family)
MLDTMRTIRRLTILGVLVAAVSSRAAAQDEYPQTLYWGSGLIDIPVAWVSPLTGDFALNYSGKSFKDDPNATKINYSNSLNSNLVFSMSFGGRLEGGVSWFSSNPEYGFFARGLLMDENQFRERGGWARLLIPSIALGAHNIGSYDQIDRFGIGYDLLPPTAEDPDAQHVADSLHQGFDTGPTFYGVATKSISLADIRPNWADINFGFTVGFGNGLFQDHGNLARSQYAKNATGGLFYGVKTDFAPGPNMTLSLMAENNAWDFNVGGSLAYRGLRAGLYFTELGAGSAAPDSLNPNTVYYNYNKAAFTIAWQSNIFALLRGDFLQNKAAQLERRRQGLLAQITERQRRIAALELEINRYEAQNLLELEQRRAAAEAELRQEREALRRLEERLRRVEQQNPTPRPPQR